MVDLTLQHGTLTDHLLDGVRRALSVEALAQASAHLPGVEVQVVAAGGTAYQLGLAIAAIEDAITKRLLELAQAELNEQPPCAYAWVAFGSQARREQTAGSDQDNGLILAEMGAENHPYFASLARFLNEGLAACGFPLCPGAVMASNGAWRQPLPRWRSYFDEWIERPQPKALMHASIFFDLRAVVGDDTLARTLQAYVLPKVANNHVFLAHLVANAVRHRAPLGLFRNLLLERGGEHSGTLDVKHQGVLAIVALARVYALAAGSMAVGTVERLRDAADRQSLSRAGAEDLERALSFIGAVRARHQAEQVKEGLAPDNHVRPEELSPGDQKQLKAALVVIRRHQEALATLYPIDRLA